ncbi:RNA exonuclease 3 [Golovinomyces cichoracearum]|uniref:RNA exonuclease 3 n=1 Tax=Golovinomyces cichoracearum TaxID=62708 RepID=A0A420J1X6_9PEZI|nr:RNA exonuclease 3 [Golovinomyces cichoracearum]
MNVTLYTSRISCRGGFRSYNLLRFKNLLSPNFQELFSITMTARSISSVMKNPLPEIKLSADYLERLRSFIQPKDVLEKNGYILNQLSKKDLERKKRCAQCGKHILKPVFKKQKDEISANNQKILKSASPSPVDQKIEDLISELEIKNGPQSAETIDLKKKKSEKKKPVMHCTFHSGGLRKQFWDCCGNHKFNKGCQESEYHLPRYYMQGELEKFWKYYPTPPVSKDIEPRTAVAIDCEMGINVNGETELLRISAIDYFTSEVLLNILVYPDEQMGDYHTRYSGVSHKQMQTAFRKRQCLLGRKAAREAMWKFVGPQTILIGHSANNDLSALRWIHTRVIDTMLIDLLIFNEQRRLAEANKTKDEDENNLDSITEIDSTKNSLAVQATHNKPKNLSGTGRLSLKQLAKSRLGKDIQQGRVGHDSLEDAIATRDLAHWNVVVRGAQGTSSP